MSTSNPEQPSSTTQFTDADRLNFIERHTTLHMNIEIAYVVDGYEVTATWDGSPLTEAHKGPTLREALNILMQGGDIPRPFSS